jgi:DNA repair protein RecO (recombination protein O)
MAAEQKAAAIVLHASDYGEADRIVCALTREQGKLSGIARGLRKSRGRFERRLEPFSHVMLYFRRRPHGELVFITRAELAGLEAYEPGNDLGKFALGAYMLELSGALIREGVDAAGAYDLLAAALSELCRWGASNALRQAFELKLLRWAGYGLDFGRCRRCAADAGERRDLRFAFVVAEGGLLCERCWGANLSSVQKLGSSSLEQLRRLTLLPIEEACAEKAASADAAGAIDRFITYTIERKLRSLAFLEAMLPTPARAHP